MSSFSRKCSSVIGSVSVRVSRSPLILFATVLTAVVLAVSLFRSQAQENFSPGSRSKQVPIIKNVDIRANGGIDTLMRSVEKHSGRGTNYVEDVTAFARDQRASVDSALVEIRKQRPSAEVTFSPLTGSVEVLRSDGTLTGPEPGATAKDIALNFISRNRAIYGIDDTDIDNLHYVGESVNEYSGLRMALFEQMVNGRPVFQGDCKISIDRDGRVIQSLSNFAPKASSQAPVIRDLLPVPHALASAMASVDVLLDVRLMRVSSEKGSWEAKIEISDRRVLGPVHAKVVYFPLAPGVLVPAWSLTIFSDNADWYAIVDATDGTLLWRKNIRSDVSTHQARFRVYVQADGSTPADSPAPLSPSNLTAGFQPPGIAPSIVNMLTVQNITASPNGWIDDCPGGVCTANETQTLGNNALVCIDRVADNVCDLAAGSVLDGNGRPRGNADVSVRDRDFLGLALRDFESSYLPAPQGGNPEAGQTSTGAVPPFLRGSAVQQFYVTNWYHDRLFSLGFTPAARNFQQLNFGGGGAQNDRVLVDVQDGSGINNANFATPSDGVSGRAQMFNFDGPTIDRDGGLDSEILIHELTHGTSNRLVGNAAGLFWDIGGSMGEGWSDFYALALLNNTNADDPNLGYASGAYATYKLASPIVTSNYTYGIRRFPYHTNNGVNPMTWADVDDVTNNLSGGMAPSPLLFNDGGAMEVHNAGEIWTLTLWEVRSRIIADPAGANGNVPTGNNTTLSIVTDAMRLFTPSNPSFIGGRNALIDADCAANAACPNEVSIWGGFADRGLGYRAVAPLGYGFGLAAAHMSVGESFASPNLDIDTLTVDDSVTNNTGAIDPNETVRLVFNVRNPWRGAARNATGVTATLTTSTAGASIVQGATTYPAIAANTTANPNGPFLLLKAPTSAACGSSIDVTLTLNSSLGSVARNFKIRLGVPTGTAPAITYTRNPEPNIAIPDNAPRGVGDSLSITDDFEISDLNFRVDSLTHTWVGDVTVLLRAPNGYGTDLISAVGCRAVAGCNSGDNFINTVIDQTAAAPNDLPATAGSAPFTDDWLPAWNSPSWLAGGFPSIDPVGQMTRYNGLSTQGTWNVRVSDVVAGDTGSLNQWSLIVTPRAFTCTPFAPTAAPISISGRVLDTNSSGVMKATVTVSSPDGETRQTLTNAWGYFRIENLELGRTYLIEVGSKRFVYAPRSINAVDDVVDLIFTPLE